jgi:tetratricopeptide (TPR) repeat protein
MIRKAQELDPLSLIISDNVGWTYYGAGRYDEAIRAYQKTLEFDASFIPGLRDIGQAYMQKKMYSEAEKILLKRRQLSDVVENDFALLYALSGKKEQANAMLDHLIKQVEQGALLPYDLAEVYASLNQPDAAFHWLEKAFFEHDVHLTYLKWDPLLKNIRSDRRMADLERRIGLW